MAAFRKPLNNVKVEDVLVEYDMIDCVAGLEDPQDRVPYADGYLTNANAGGNQFAFFGPAGRYDPGIVTFAEETKQAIAPGEFLTLGGGTGANSFKGPVLVLTGCEFCPVSSPSFFPSSPSPPYASSSQIARLLTILFLFSANDLPFCGGDCFATGNPKLPSIPTAVELAFPNVTKGDFAVVIQPQTGHGINMHFNATGAYDVIGAF